MQFKPYEKNIEVNGRTIKSVILGFKTFKTLATRFLLNEKIGIIGEDGLISIKDDDWYPQEAWLKSFEKIALELGDHNLYQIGRSIPDSAIFPETVKDIYSAIKSIDVAYHLNHRKDKQVMFNIQTNEMLEGIGHYGYQPIDTKNLIISECNNPFPCAFDRGIIESMARKYSPNASVIHDDSKSCRKNGKDACTYIVTW